MYQGVLFCTFMRVIVMIFNHKDVSHRVYVDFLCNFFLLNIKIMEMYVRYVNESCDFSALYALLLLSFVR